MQSNKQNSAIRLINDGGGEGYLPCAPRASFVGAMVSSPGAESLGHFHRVEVQPCEACPKNLIIFDKTDNRSKIMFHPAIGSKMCYAGLRFDPPSWGNIERYSAYNEDREVSSYAEEDSEDIDALLSLETDYGEESDEEEVSTARTDPDYGCNSLDSCSNYEPLPKKCRQPPSKKSTASGSSFSGRKHQKMKNMVNGLRGIIPGTGRMSTVAVLDEAVRYLKSLKVEVQKPGVKNSKSFT